MIIGRGAYFVEILEYTPLLMIVHCIVFLIIYFFLPEDGPRWPKRVVVSVINSLQRQLCFDIPSPSHARNSLYSSLCFFNLCFRSDKMHYVPLLGIWYRECVGVRLLIYI